MAGSTGPFTRTSEKVERLISAVTGWTRRVLSDQLQLKNNIYTNILAYLGNKITSNNWIKLPEQPTHHRGPGLALTLRRDKKVGAEIGSRDHGWVYNGELANSCFLNSS